MSTSTARQIRGKSAQPRSDSDGAESHAQGRTTRSMSKRKKPTTQKAPNKKKVQVATKSKKVHTDSKKTHSPPQRTKHNKSEPTTAKIAKKHDFLLEERESTEPKEIKAGSLAKHEKDSWGDTIFKESEPRDPESSKKMPSSKRKSHGIAQGDPFEKDLSQAKAKKSKQMKESLGKGHDIIASKSKTSASTRRTDKDKQTKTIIQLDIALTEVDIPITRRILISDEVNFARLARIIVASMGWKGYYDWKFVIQDHEILFPEVGASHDGKTFADEVYLDEFELEAGQSFEFLYNLNCNWRHLVRVLEIKEMTTKGQYERGNPTFNPVVISGENACPPDEVEGGAKEYNNMLVVLKTEMPKTAYDEIIEIYGKDFDPYEFKLKTVNNLLKNFPYDDEFDTTKCEHDDIFKW